MARGLKRQGLKGYPFSLAIILLFLFVTAPSLAEVAGLVISVIDGDTIEVLHDQRPERIRLSGIDCPEKGQSFGKRAKQAASDLASGKRSPSRPTVTTSTNASSGT